MTAVGQTMPTELTSSPIQEQIKYLEDHTRIYENFRAIREDMFQKINRNFMDTLSLERNRIIGLKKLTADLNSKTDSLNTLLNTTRVDLEEATASKSKISVLGMNLNKSVYNSIMWTIIAGLVVLLVLGFLVFKRNLNLLVRTGKDLQELKDEFEEYRQTSRLAREKVEMENYRMLQKLKGE
jgi:hypothetical protein